MLEKTKILALLLLLFIPIFGFTQIKPMVKKGVTRALVVGISDYQNKNIPDLNYAHIDALAFADFLQTPSGGNLQSDQITLLINEQATHGQIISELTGLLDESQKGDKVIIYFSGHGDLETKTIDQYGFLLAYNAPAMTYMIGGTVPVIYLQSIIKTLTIQKEVQVILISDACRAGKLAGHEIGGTQATASAMAKQFANEIKILSCQANEFSLEGKQWGGGRGAFSFHLIDGLHGFADRNKNGEINLLEIEQYLQNIIPTEVAPHEQIPMTVGNKGAKLFKVDEQQYLARKKEKDKKIYGFAAVDTKGLEELVFEKADSNLQPLYQKFLQAISAKKLLDKSDESAYALYQRLEKEESLQPLRGLMRRNLAAALQDEAQVAINDYLESDPTEMARRWNKSELYKAYPEYLGKAAELLGQGHYMHTELESRQHYFSGLNYRLQGEKLRSDSMYQLAIILQNKAIELSANAPYAYNELGLIHRRLRKYNKAIEYFKKANELSPTWVLPINNLCRTFINLKKYKEAENYGKKAIELRPEFVLPYYNLGLLCYRTKNFKESIKYYTKAIEVAPDYQVAYHDLGYAYMQAGDHEMAEKVFLNCSKRFPKQAGNFNILGLFYKDRNKYTKAITIFQKANEVDPTYPYSYYNIGELYLSTKDYNKAISAFENYIKLEPADPDGYYNLACIASINKEKEIALNWLEKAFQNGYKNYEHLKKDSDLIELQSDPAFQGLLKRYFPDK